MADLANLLGGYGSGSEDDEADNNQDASMGSPAGGATDALLAAAGGVVVRAGETAAGAGDGDGDGDGEAGASAPSRSAMDTDDATPAAAGGSQQHPHVMEGPSTNPEPPPEVAATSQRPADGVDGVDGDGDDASPGAAASAPDPRLLLLPPELRDPPPGPVDPVILEKAALIDRVQRQKGVTIMETLARDRRWSNPTFLEKMVGHFGLDPYGSCFRPEVWDPKALPEEDTWPR